MAPGPHVHPDDATEAVGRAAAMAERVLREARRAGASGASLPLLERAHTLAMRPRLAVPLDAHAPDLLHPGRSALILLIDLSESDPTTLAAALLAESEREPLRVAREEIETILGGALGSEVAELREQIPPGDSPELAERLLLAPEPAQRAALAERLDHLRHAHLWPELIRRRAAHRVATEVYAEIARRVHPTLARRYDWWCRMFAERHLG